MGSKVYSLLTGRLIGKDAASKIHKIREWIKAQPPAVPAYSKGEPTPAHKHVGTLIISLPQIGEFGANSP